MASIVDQMDGLNVAPATTVAGSSSLLDAGTLTIEVIAGRDLVIKDRGFLRSNSSDPFCTVSVDGTIVGTTPVVSKNLNPTWRWSTTVETRKGAAKKLIVACFDKDGISEDDPMGEVAIDVGASLRTFEASTRVCRWYAVTNCAGCANASGSLEVAVTWAPRVVVALTRGTSFAVDRPDRALVVGLGWTGAYGAAVDLDASCVFFDAAGRVADALYYGKPCCFDGAARHGGDARTGAEAAGEDDADERLELALARLPRDVASMLVVVTAYAEKSSFVDMRSAFVGLWDPARGEMCRYALDCRGTHTGLVMCRLARRETDAAAWTLNAIGAVAEGPRDWGSWVPELKAYLRDICPGVVVGAARDRVAVLRKGGVVDLARYVDAFPCVVAMGLAWDITRGRSIDLDGSAILLRADLSCEAIVSFARLDWERVVSHSGDDRSGDGGGDDEVITCRLDALPPRVAHVAFVVTAFDGSTFANVDNVACRVFAGGRDLARFALSSAAYDCTGLLMAVLSRDGPTWLMRAAGEGCTGQRASDCVDEAQEWIATGKIGPR